MPPYTGARSSGSNVDVEEIEDDVAALDTRVDALEDDETAGVVATIVVDPPTGVAATDRANIAAALVAAAGTVTSDVSAPASGAGTPKSSTRVQLRPGIYLTDQTLQVGTMSELAGAAGWATTIKAANGLNADVLSVGGTKMWGTCVRDLVIDGNKANQTAGHGVHCKTHGNFAPWLTGDPDVVGAGMWVLDRVLVVNAKQDGFFFAGGTSEIKVLTCMQTGAGRYGFNNESADNDFVQCTSAGSGKAGFRISNAVNRYTNCKSYGAGDDGVYVGGGGFSVSGHSNSFFNCEAQECYFDGLEILAGGTGTQWYGRVSGVGGNAVTVADNVVDCDVEFTYLDSTYGFSVVSLVAVGTVGCVRNKIRARSIDVPDYYTANATGATALANAFEINNESGQQKVAYAASITPNPYLGSTVVVGTLTGDITVNNPSTGGALDTKAHIGTRLTFIFVQDATGGRAVTWGSEFADLVTLGTTAWAVNSVTFEWTGEYWAQVAAGTTDATGGGGSALLASTVYNPGSLTAKTTTSATYADMDATNLAVTFEAPASGDVIVVQTATAYCSTAGTSLAWGLRNGAANVAGSRSRAWITDDSAPMSRVSHRSKITGLTPGNSYTFKWSHARDAGSGDAQTYMGEDGTDFLGAALMEVYAA